MFNATAQILLRSGLRDVEFGPLVAQRDITGLLTSILTLNVVGGFLCFGLGAVFWMYVLSHLPVGVAYPMMSLAYVTAVFMGWFFLKESLSLFRLAGLILICAGVWIVARSA